MPFTLGSLTVQILRAQAPSLAMIKTAPPLDARSVQAVVATGHQAPTQTPTQTAIKFWGVRGSVPTPTPDHQRYGGNTVCVEITMGNEHIICDGGTGVVGLGHHLAKQADSVKSHMLFTHTQWDRIQGFPFFRPAFAAGNHFSIYGGVAPNGASIKHCLTDQMLKPHFSMPMQNMRAELDFNTIAPQEHFCIGDVSVETIQLNPTSLALGYSLIYQGKKVVYATDAPTEGLSADFVTFAEGADVLIYDGTYADLGYLNSEDTALSNEMNAATMVGVEPWDLGIEIAQKAQVKQLVLLHHSPVQNDSDLDQLQQEVQSQFKQVTVAYEGLTITL